MRVVSWNVNGLRACAKKGFGGWLQRSGGAQPSAIALEWRGQELSLDVERADGSRACRTLELQAPPPSPDPRHTSLELGFSELPEGATVTARLTDPTLVVLTD